MNKKTKMLLGVAVLAAAGYYFFIKNKKDKKVNASGKSNSCVFMEGGELVDGKISSYDSNTCVSKSGKKGTVYSEHQQEWKSQI